MVRVGDTLGVGRYVGEALFDHDGVTVTDTLVVTVTDTDTLYDVVTDTDGEVEAPNDHVGVAVKDVVNEAVLLLDVVREIEDVFVTVCVEE